MVALHMVVGPLDTMVSPSAWWLGSQAPWHHPVHGGRATRHHGIRLSVVVGQSDTVVSPSARWQGHVITLYMVVGLPGTMESPSVWP